jgi:PTH2 family peptidyl-tRNA hydrolase
MRIPNELIMDAGLTQLPPGTTTVLGIGPDTDEKIDAIVHSLKLL